jgi:hypothetical protein
MKVSREDYDAIQRLFTEHDEDVRGYDPEVYQPMRELHLTLGRALVLGTLIAFWLYWLGGLLGALWKL